MHERVFTSLTIRKMQIKTTNSYHYTSIRNSAGKDAEKMDYSYFTGGNVKWYSYSRNHLASSLKTKHVAKYKARIYSLGFLYQRNEDSYTQKSILKVRVVLS